MNPIITQSINFTHKREKGLQERLADYIKEYEATHVMMKSNPQAKWQRDAIVKKFWRTIEKENKERGISR